MSAALQIGYTSFDAVFLKLPPEIRARIEAKIDELGLPWCRAAPSPSSPPCPVAKATTGN
jgi:hypothetical protein